MKWSRYNITYQKDDNVFILYNYSTDSFIFLLNDLRKIVESLKDDIDTLYNIHPELYNELIKKEFIVDNELNEVKAATNRIIERLNSPEIFKLTINPTLDCNLKCWYCYENHISNSLINSSTLEGIKNLLLRKTIIGDLKKVELSFFGGEPLYRTKGTVLSIISFTKDICERNNKELRIHFTTNGTLLNLTLIKELVRLCPAISVQIPFDGGREEHNKVKKFINSKGTYDIILKNVISALENGIKVNIRCNYSSPENLDSFKELIENFDVIAKQYKGLMNFGMQQVWQVSPSLILDKKVSEIRSLLIRSNFKNNLTGQGAVSSPCYADYTESLVVNYNGDVFKCTARDFTKENRIGILQLDGAIIFNDNYLKRTKRMINTECLNCNILPICTICSQKKYETTIENKCPKEISEEDKKNQIIYRLRSICYNYL